jgi:glycerol-3-phosphate acyltransferase PlsY
LEAVMIATAIGVLLSAGAWVVAMVLAWWLTVLPPLMLSIALVLSLAANFMLYIIAVDTARDLNQLEKETHQ